tara:strand:+ start:180 stop:971 length:792 start_codon:yes stop_codon:yes gene_type:complete
MKYWMNIIRKSGSTELVLNVNDLPEDMQRALTAAGLGSEELGIMGAFHADKKNVYIFLPEFARQLRARNPSLDLSSVRAERLIINQLLGVIEHENLHMVMDKEIKEFAINMADDFIDQVIIPNTVSYLDSVDNISYMLMGQMTVETLRPMIRDLLKDTGKHLIHEIMVRMVMQMDNRKIIDELTPYIQQFIQLMLSQIGPIHGPLRMITQDDRGAQDMVDGLMGVFLNGIPSFWANLMRELFLRNDELIVDFIQFNMDSVMNA